MQGQSINEQKRTKLIFPAILTPFSDGSGGFTVEFPDLPGCVTEGRDLVEAIEMGIDAASGWIMGEYEDGNKFPCASEFRSIKRKNNQLVTMILLDLSVYKEKHEEKAVKKNITLPAYLAAYGEKNNIIFSKVLQDALLTMVKQDKAE